MKRKSIHKPAWERLRHWLFGPQPIERLEILRILLPLAILGFMANRLMYADHWLSEIGYQMPNLGGGDYRQPLYLAPLPAWAAWVLASGMVMSGLMVSAGFFARYASWIFAASLVYVALADRLAAFTVSKLGAVLMLALCFTPVGARYSMDAWRKLRKKPSWTPPEFVSGGNVRFFQAVLVVMYSASGICKGRGDWLSHSHVLWTHLFDSYQTAFSFVLANLLPAIAWPVFQWITLVFEAGAPVWFAWRKTRWLALSWGLAMHFVIGVTFGPVLWFSLLMMSLLIGGFVPLVWLQRVFQRAGEWVKKLFAARQTKEKA